MALLRTPELVVEYLEGPASLESGTEWAGVFCCIPEHDGKFATAEPPTHDSWRPELLPKGPDRTIVNVGLREIRRELEVRFSSSADAPVEQAASTAVVADDLARLVRTTEGLGKGLKPRRNGTSATTANARVEVVSSGPIEHQGGFATRVLLEVRHRAGSTGTRLHATCGAALDGSTSDPTFDPVMSLVSASWAGHTASLSGLSATVDLDGPSTTQVELIVARSPSISVLFDLQADPIESA